MKDFAENYAVPLMSDNYNDFMITIITSSGFLTASYMRPPPEICSIHRE